MLGKQPPRFDDRSLRLARYLRPELPAPPPIVTWSEAMKLPWGMMLNDSLSDCTCAGPGHAIQSWTANASGTAVTVPDRAILAAYRAVSGYDPATGANDNGAVELDVLKLWRSVGIGYHRIGAFGDLGDGDLVNAHQCLWLFGGLYIGLSLPASAQDQVGQIWTPTSGRDARAGTWGGHAVIVLDRDKAAGTWTCVTWGELQVMDDAFMDAYCDEIHAMVSADWLADTSRAPSGLDMPALLADLSAVTRDAA
jgi:hypothetical protein